MATTAAPHSQEAAPEDQLYQPAANERQLTARAIAAGCLVGGVVGAMNVYLGLKIAFIDGGSITAAILGFALFRVLGQSLSVLECNTTQTTGSAAATMTGAAGLIAAIPAMELLGVEIPLFGLYAWALSISYLGVFFAIPLRQQMVVVDKLPFPFGTATAKTILAMFETASDAVDKARALMWAGVLAGLFTLATYFVPSLEMPFPDWFGIAALAAAVSWGFQVYLGPMLFGAGLLIGPRVGLSLFLGACIAWGALGPWAKSAGWSAGDVMSYTDGARGWLIWPGVAVMVAEALSSLALNWRTFARTFRAPGAVALEQGVEDVPLSWVRNGLAVSAAGTAVAAWILFEIPLHLTILALALSFVLAAVATRSGGETGINPIGPVSKVTQLVYGGLQPGNITMNLMTAAITGAGASQCADMMQDLKAGRLLGASPRRQFLAQLVGIAAGVIFCVPAYRLMTSAYPLGGEQLPAPGAFSWKAMAEVLTQGWSAVPAHVGPFVLVGLALGILLPILRSKPAVAPYLPSGMAIGIGFLIPAFFSVTFLCGSLTLVIWNGLSASTAAKFSLAVASGLMAGEGIFGIVKAGMTLLGVPTF